MYDKLDYSYPDLIHYNENDLIGYLQTANDNWEPYTKISSPLTQNTLSLKT